MTPTRKSIENSVRLSEVKLQPTAKKRIFLHHWPTIPTISPYQSLQSKNIFHSFSAELNFSVQKKILPMIFMILEMAIIFNESKE